MPSRPPSKTPAAPGGAARKSTTIRRSRNPKHGRNPKHPKKGKKPNAQSRPMRSRRQGKYAVALSRDAALGSSGFSVSARPDHSGDRVDRGDAGLGDRGRGGDPARFG